MQGIFLSCFKKKLHEEIPSAPFTKGVREGGMTGGIKFIIAGEGYRIV